MNQAWAPVVAALGASLLTGLLIVMRDIWHDRRDSGAALQTRRTGAYEALLTQSGLVVHTAGALHLAIEQRSGLKEGLDVALHIRKPMDALQLEDWMRRDLAPIYLALATVWACGTDAGIQASNDLVQLCGEVVGTAAVRGQGASAVMRFLSGEKWTKAQLNEWEASLSRLVTARVKLAALIRKEGGADAVDFLAASPSANNA